MSSALRFSAGRPDDEAVRLLQSADASGFESAAPAISRTARPLADGIAAHRARLHLLDRISARNPASRHGTLVFRNEDLDPQRSKPDFAEAMLEDLRWLGIRWQEGPDIGGPFEPYQQSRRRELYVETWRKLRDGGFIYPCTCSRKDLALSPAAPNEGDDEPLYPGRCRHKVSSARDYETPLGVNWRLLVPDGEAIGFDDLHQGPQSFVAGRDFGDLVVWRRDDVPAYQLAV